MPDFGVVFSDEDVLAFRHLARHISSKFNLSESDLLGIIKGSDELLIPASIFIEKLSCLESVCKYLKENKGLRLVRIAELLKRDSRTIWTTYRKAAIKHPGRLPELEGVYIPASAIADRSLAVLESLALYLASHSFDARSIAAILHRDYKTIWTTLKHARGKK